MKHNEILPNVIKHNENYISRKYVSYENIICVCVHIVIFYNNICDLFVMLHIMKQKCVYVCVNNIIFLCMFVILCFHAKNIAFKRLYVKK